MASPAQSELTKFAGEVERQKELGAFYTPLEMASKMVAWAVRSAEDQVLDTSFGGLSFLAPAADRLRVLGSENTGAQLYGCDLDKDAYEGAIGRPWLREENLLHRDFFTVRPAADLPLVEAVIGNPPYVRYQGFNGSGSRGHQLAAEAGIKLTRLASSWAPFVIHSTAFVAGGGRLALVLPAELLHAQYAADVLGFVQKHFAQVGLACFEQRVFPGALADVVLLFAQGRGEGESLGVRVFDCEAVEDLDIETLSQGLLGSQAVSNSRGKLLSHLLPVETRDLYEELASTAGVVRLGDIASVDIGAVTGANEFFLLREDDYPEIHPQLLRTTVSKARHVQGARLTTHDVLELRDSGARFRMFYPDDYLRGLGGTGAQLSLDAGRDAEGADAVLATAERYLSDGQMLGVAERYKCRVRPIWWAVPRIKNSPDLLLTYCSRDHPRLVANDAGALNTNTLHGVRLDRDAGVEADALAVAYLNSLTMLSTELVGRSYGGGVLKLEPTEAEALLIPVIDYEMQMALTALLPEVDGLIRARELDSALDLVDKLVLGQGLGLTKDKQAALRSGAERLRGRRRARSKTPALAGESVAG